MILNLKSSDHFLTMESLSNDNSKNYSLSSSEGPSTSKLFSALELTCKKFILSIKYSVFKSAFKEIYRRNPGALKEIYDQLSSHLTEAITEDLDQLSKEHRIDFLLSSLDDIRKNQQDPSQPSWRPSGNPEEDLRDHIYPLKLKKKEILEAMLTKLTIGNEELINAVAVNHAEIMHIKKNDENLHEKFTKIVTSLTGPNQHSLRGALKNNKDSGVDSGDESKSSDPKTCYKHAF